MGTMGKPDDGFESSESARTSERIVAVILLCIGWSIAFWVWPSGIADIPLVNITFGSLLPAVASVGIAFAVLVMAALLWID